VAVLYRKRFLYRGDPSIDQVHLGRGGSRARTYISCAPTSYFICQSTGIPVQYCRSTRRDGRPSQAPGSAASSGALWAARRRPRGQARGQRPERRGQQQPAPHPQGKGTGVRGDLSPSLSPSPWWWSGCATPRPTGCVPEGLWGGGTRASDVGQAAAPEWTSTLHTVRNPRRRPPTLSEPSPVRRQGGTRFNLKSLGLA
jgi:hypothetical protein